MRGCVLPSVRVLLGAWLDGDEALRVDRASAVAGGAGVISDDVAAGRVADAGDVQVDPLVGEDHVTRLELLGADDADAAAIVERRIGRVANHTSALHDCL